MKEELPNEKLREAEDMEIDIKELLFKCLTLALVRRNGGGLFDCRLCLFVYCYSCI